MIDKAKIACEESGNIIDDHFARVSEMVQIGSYAIEKVEKCCKIKNFGCYQHPGRSTAKTRLTKGVDKRHIV